MHAVFSSMARKTLAVLRGPATGMISSIIALAGPRVAPSAFMTTPVATSKLAYLVTIGTINSAAPCAGSTSETAEEHGHQMAVDTRNIHDTFLKLSSCCWNSNRRSHAHVPIRIINLWCVATASNAPFSRYHCPQHPIRYPQPSLPVLPSDCLLFTFSSPVILVCYPWHCFYWIFMYTFFPTAFHINALPFRSYIPQTLYLPRVRQLSSLYSTCNVSLTGYESQLPVLKP